MAEARKPKRKYTGDITATRLRIVAVERYDRTTKEWTEAWGDLRDAYRQAGHLAHIGARVVFEGLADLYERGKDHKGKPSDPHAINRAEASALAKPMYSTMRRASQTYERTITSGHVAMLAQDLFAKEFSDGANKSKLADIVHGNRGFPVPHNIGMPIRPADWYMGIDERTIQTKKGEKTIISPVIYLASLFSKNRVSEARIRLVCAPPRRRGSASVWSIVKSVAAVPKGQKTWNEDGYKRGTVTIKRMKRPQDARARWMAVVAYGSPKVTAPEEKECALFVHRGVAHTVMIAAVSKDGIAFHPYYGHHVVDMKAQMRARKKRYQADTSSPRGNGRGWRRRMRKLRSLGDKERKATDTALWRVARHVQTIAERVGATHAIIEDMGTFRCDVVDDGDRAIPSYIRDWPYAALKLKVIDALTRRAGVKVGEVPTKYISQRCPNCEYSSKENIRKLPKVFASQDWKGGVFRCEMCLFTRDLDETAIMNMIAGSRLKWAHKALRKHLDDVKRWKAERDDVDDPDHPQSSPGALPV